MSENAAERGVDRGRRGALLAGAAVAGGAGAFVATGLLSPVRADAETASQTEMQQIHGGISAALYGFDPAASGATNLAALQAAAVDATASNACLAVILAPGTYSIALSSAGTAVELPGGASILAGAGTVILNVTTASSTTSYSLFGAAEDVNLTLAGFTVNGPASFPSGGATLSLVSISGTSGITPSPPTAELNVDTVVVTGGFTDTFVVAATQPVPHYTLLENCSIGGSSRPVTVGANDSAPRWLDVRDCTLHDLAGPSSPSAFVIVDPAVDVGVVRTRFVNAAAGGRAWTQDGTSSSTAPPGRLRLTSCSFVGAGSIGTSPLACTIFASCAFVGPAPSITANAVTQFIGCTFRPAAGAESAFTLVTNGSQEMTVSNCVFDVSAVSTSLVTVLAIPGSGGVRIVGSTLRTLTANDPTWLAVSGSAAFVELFDDLLVMPSSGNGGNFACSSGTTRFHRLRAIGNTGSGGLVVDGGSDPSLWFVGCDFRQLTGGPAVAVGSVGTLVRGHWNLFPAVSGSDNVCPSVSVAATAPPAEGQQATLVSLAGRPTRAASVLTAASTMPITWAADLFHVSGSTPIAAITIQGSDNQARAYDGTIQLVADSAITLTNTTSGPGLPTGYIQTNSGVDHSIAAGTTVTLCFDQSTLSWREGA